VRRQKKGSTDDLTAFSKEIEELLSLLEFEPTWKKLPVIARAARIEGAEKPVPYRENITLPDTKHDLQLILKMLNFMREQKKLQAVKMPLFIQPDEISLARTTGKFDGDEGKIISQTSVVIQRGAIMFVGFVFGPNYVILQN